MTKYLWGMGYVVRGAGGSKGQTRSSKIWMELQSNAARRLRENSRTDQLEDGGEDD